jgi:hypothetical protein
MITMRHDIRFEELGKPERVLLLRAFDYEVDSEGYILDPNGSRIPSTEIPGLFLHIEKVSLLPGSLKVMDGTPTAISKFIRERMDVPVPDS